MPKVAKSIFGTLSACDKHDILLLSFLAGTHS